MYNYSDVYMLAHMSFKPKSKTGGVNPEALGDYVIVGLSLAEHVLLAIK